MTQLDSWLYSKELAIINNVLKTGHMACHMTPRVVIYNKNPNI